ncbi:MAG: hypothetical protein V7L04_27825 [Nostoc sp.]|uniref:hypothetical protein n=1 Tax=Nostoc sp. TaxID=1180 RepID=UPI002FF65238
MRIPTFTAIALQLNAIALTLGMRRVWGVAMRLYAGTSFNCLFTSLSNRIKVPVARIHLGILCHWWMNKRRLRPPQNKKIWWSSISGESESPTDCILTNVFFFNRISLIVVRCREIAL